MQVEYQTTERDYFRFMYYESKEAIRTKYILFIIAIVFAAITFAGNPINWWKFLIGLFILPVLWIILFGIGFLRMIYIIRQSRLTPKSYTDKKILNVNDEGLFAKYISSGHTQSFLWKEIASVKFSQDAIYFTLMNKQKFFVPKRYFTPEDVTEFSKIVQTNFSKIPFWVDTPSH